jgi:hypothetical protein
LRAFVQKPKHVEIMGTELSSVKLGGNIDCWCGKCKLILAHTIEAMVGTKPARVHCNTCKSQHSYKPDAPNSPRQTRPREAGSGITRQPRPRVSRYQSLLKDSDPAVAKAYSPKDKYELGQVLEHPVFGRGIATNIKDETKIEVLFESGSKLLVHGR